MTTMIFYERAIALNRARHQNLKLDLKSDHFTFAANTNSVLLAGSEFAEASRDYPIVFVGKEGGPFTLAALVGLGDKENLMVSASGKWEEGTYIPAFIRRYPFVLAGTDDAESLTVCVDEAYGGLNEERGEGLFAVDGAQSDYLNNVIEFLRLFHSEMRRTSTFAAKLAELGILTSKVITIERDGKKQTLEGLWVVDEAKLDALDDASMLELVRTGYLGWVYAHLLSLNNIARLAKRLDARRIAALDSTPVPASDVVH
ncbi:SapC family protein [Actimicrobium antarcticum]|uniref:SapC family protein n=1 Tax=Actimicrobium antarcticum TaxID=1051899 RepID=A0ABP7SI71_9BURK